MSKRILPRAELLNLQPVTMAIHKRTLVSHECAITQRRLSTRRKARGRNYRFSLIHAGAWSLAFSSALTSPSTPASTKQDATTLLRRRWSSLRHLDPG